MKIMEAQKQYLGCIFDLDGTVLDSKKGFDESLRLALKHFGIDVKGQTFSHLIGPPIRAILKEAFPALSSELVESISLKFREYFDSSGCLQAKLYPGATLVLEAISKKGIKNLLCTNKPASATTRVLEHFGLNKFFTTVMCPEPGTFPAIPKKDLMEAALISAGLKTTNVLIVGDTEEDLIAAQGIGCDFAGALYGYGKDLRLAPGLTHELESLEQIVPILKL